MYCSARSRLPRLNSIQPLVSQISNSNWVGGQILKAQVVEIHVAQLRLQRIDGRIGVLVGAVELHVLLGQSE